MDLLTMLWKEAEEKKDRVKTWGKIYNWLNEDNLGRIELNRDVFWFELNPYGCMPNYIYDHLKKWGTRKGYVYLYDLK